MSLEKICCSANADRVCESSLSLSQAIIEKCAILKLPTYIHGFNCNKAFLLADINTFTAAGEKVCAVLESSGIAYNKYVFPTGDIEPDEAAVGSAVMNFDKTCDLIIGIGSGVINDIGKILANVTGLPYFIVATAPSMDGYASASSSMTVAGLKKSLNSKSADLIIGDIDILCQAPVKMMLAGLGDMIAKYVSICSWRISNLVTGEDYCEEIAGLVREALKKCVDNSAGLLCRDEEAVKAIFEGLILCGAAMKIANTSRPASGVEHYISHIWDMRGVEFGTPTDFHGVQCALGTLIAVKLYEKTLTFIPDEKKALEYAKAFDYHSWCEELRGFLGKGAESMIDSEKKEGKYDLEKHEKRLLNIICNWDNIKRIVEEELPAYEDLKKLFVRLGLPVQMEEIGLDEAILPMTVKATKDIRDKYVLSRLLWDLGVIDEIFKEACI